LIKKTIDPAEEILLIFLGLSVHPSPSSRRHLHSILQISIIHHTKRQLKNFDKRGKLISTLKRTFYEASAAEEEDRRRRRGRGDSAEDETVDVCSGPFVVTGGGSERDRPAETSEHTDRASDLLRRERE
jgi:hypothetical protein